MAKMCESEKFWKYPAFKLYKDIKDGKQFAKCKNENFSVNQRQLHLLVNTLNSCRQQFFPSPYGKRVWNVARSMVSRNEISDMALLKYCSKNDLVTPIGLASRRKAKGDLEWAIVYLWQLALLTGNFQLFRKMQSVYGAHFDIFTTSKFVNSAETESSNPVFLEKLIHGGYSNSSNTWSCWPGVIEHKSCLDPVCVISELYGQGYDLMKKNCANNKNICHVASDCGECNVVSYLMQISNPKDIWTTDADGNTVMHLAAKGDFANVGACLVMGDMYTFSKFSTILSTKNKKNMTPIDMCYAHTYGPPLFVDMCKYFIMQRFWTKIFDMISYCRNVWRMIFSFMGESIFSEWQKSDELW